VNSNHSCSLPGNLDRNLSKILIDAIYGSGIDGKPDGNGELHYEVKSVRCLIFKGMRASSPNRLDRRFRCDLQ
jgi:hypothetical protein